MGNEATPPATDSGKKTVNDNAPLIPGRAAILKDFAALAMGTAPEEKVAPAAAGGEKPKALSQDKAAPSGAATGGQVEETPEAKVEREATETAELAERAKVSGLTPEAQKAAEDQALVELTERATAAKRTVEEQFVFEEAEEAKANGGGEEDHLDAELKGVLTPETQEKINRRIGKEVAKTKAATEAKAKLESDLADAQRKLAERPNAAPVQAGPLADVSTGEALEAEAGKARAAIKQVRDLKRVLVSDPEQVEQVLKEAHVKLPEYTAAAMQEYLDRLSDNANDVLTEHIPNRANWLRKADQAGAEALQLLPELKDKNSPRCKEFWEIANLVPEIKGNPGWTKMVAVQVLGRERLREMAAAAGKPAPPKIKARVKPVVIPSPKAQPAGGAPRKAGKNELDEKTRTAALDGDKSARREILEGLV